MISTMILMATLCAQGSVSQTAPPTAAKIISGMLAHYSGLQSIVGTIKLTLMAKAPTGSVAAAVNTELQFQKPNKIYLKQVSTGQEPGEWLVTSDGKFFSYNIPAGLGPTTNKRLVENVLANTVADIYGASVNSIKDRSVPLGIAVSWTPELKRIVAKWPSYRLVGEVDWNGQKVWKIVGKFKEDPNSMIIGDFVLIIDKNGNLLEYQTTQSFATPIDETHLDAKHPTTLTETWDVTLTPDGVPNPSLFQVAVSK